MTANDSKSYLSYLNKLVDQHNNTYYQKPINNDNSAKTEKIEMKCKAPKFKLNDRESELQNIRAFLVKVTLKIGQEEYLLSTLFWKLILGLIKSKV